MGIRAIVEVLDHAPAELTPAERLILVAIAENINDNDLKRETWPGFNVEVLCRRTGLGPNGLRRAHQRLASRGLEVRIPIGVDKNGDPVFAVPNVQTRYRLPRLAVAANPQADEGGTQVPPSDEGGAPVPAGGTAVPPEPVPEYHHEGPEAVPEYRQAVREYPPTPHPSKNPPQESAPSSLSPSEASTQATDPPPVVEREKRSHSKVITPHTLVKDARVIGDHEVSDFVRWAEREHRPRGNGWWRTLIKNGDLPELVVQWYASLADEGQPPRPKDYNGSGAHIDRTVPLSTDPADVFGTPRTRKYSNDPKDVFGPASPPRPTSGPMATQDHYDEDDIWK